MQLVERYNAGSFNKIKFSGMPMSQSISDTERGEDSLRHDDKDRQVNITFEEVKQNFNKTQNSLQDAASSSYHKGSKKDIQRKNGP